MKGLLKGQLDGKQQRHYDESDESSLDGYLSAMLLEGSRSASTEELAMLSSCT